MKRKVLLILGHPYNKSYCKSLADKFVEGLEENENVEYRRIDLFDIKFNMNLEKGLREGQELESDLIKAQEDINRAEHIVIVYPIWWYSMPAILKGFIDRVLLPGFAYKFKGNGMWDKLLKGKIATNIVTMGAPAFIERFIFMGRPTKLMKEIWGFCGVKTKKIVRIGGIMSGDIDFQGGLGKVKDLAKKM